MFYIHYTHRRCLVQSISLALSLYTTFTLPFSFPFCLTFSVSVSLHFITISVSCMHEYVHARACFLWTRVVLPCEMNFESIMKHINYVALAFVQKMRHCTKQPALSLIYVEITRSSLSFCKIYQLSLSLVVVFVLTVLWFNKTTV